MVLAIVFFSSFVVCYGKVRNEDQREALVYFCFESLNVEPVLYFGVCCNHLKWLRENFTGY